MNEGLVNQLITEVDLSARNFAGLATSQELVSILREPRVGYTNCETPEASMGIPEWEEIAIPEGFGPHRLLYNPPSETVIAELRSTGEQFFPSQIFIREKDAVKYERVADSDLMISCESAVTPLGSPLIFYLSNKLTKKGARFYADFEGLYLYDLRKRTPAKMADKHSLQLPPPYVEGWVTGLVDVSAEGAELYLTAGMMGPKPSSGFRPVSCYQLARMEVKTGRIDLVCKLRGSFF